MKTYYPMQKHLFVQITFLLFYLVKVQAQEYAPYYDYGYEEFIELEEAGQLIDPAAIDYKLLQAAIFHETNRMRAANGLDALRYSEALEHAAEDHTHDMAELNFFSHRSKVKGKERITDRLKLVGLVNVAAAENIAISFLLNIKEDQSYFTPSQNGGYFSLTWKGTPIPNKTYQQAARTIVDQWMKSPGHRQNILNPKYLYLGCGASLKTPDGSDDVPMFYGTQLFTNSLGPAAPAGG
jgi:uncharacterized protein YkwD